MSKTLLTQDEYEDLVYKLNQVADVVDINYNSAKKQAEPLADKYGLSAHDLLVVAIYSDGTSDSICRLLNLLVEIKSEDSFLRTVKPLGNSGMIRMPKECIGREARVIIKYDDD